MVANQQNFGIPPNAQNEKLVGGNFIVRTTEADSIFIPEEFNEEQLMIADSFKEFMLQEIIPIIDEIDAMKDKALVPSLLEKAGELGLLSLAIPEAYGGLDLDFNTNLLAGEIAALGFSFATTIGAQTSIGSLPIVYYGTKEQKEKYLPGIISASLKASYCLTEPDAGSDANSGKTKALLNEAGTHYLLTGQKMWITNGGFADIFIVFAKIEEDEKLSAFIVEKDFGGISLGPEEKKLGIKGSSTVQVFFNECPVPIANLLGERQGGFKMALNILNTGRIKLAAGAIGGAKMALTKAITYANSRKQFNQSIGSFGAIQHKIAESAVRLFASESAIYRIGKNIDNKYDELVSSGLASAEAKLEAIREFAIECAIMKVHGSEVVTYVVDESLQVHGGMGYAVETGIERGYRDARITRIYEGTNEINRMLAVGELFKRAFKYKAIDLTGALKTAPKDWIYQRIPFRNKKERFYTEKQHIQNLKNVFLLVGLRAAQKLKLTLADQQELVMNLSDILAEAYVCESVWLRVEKLYKQQVGIKDKALIMKHKMAQVYLYEAINKVSKAAEDAILSFTKGAEKKVMLTVLAQLCSRYDINPLAVRREIADYYLTQNHYPLHGLKLPVELM